MKDAPSSNPPGVATANGKPPKKILLIRWKCLGDVLFTLPAFNCLRANFPDSHITYLTSREYAPLLEGFSGLNEVFIVDRTALKKFRAGGLKELKNLWRGIIGSHYDLVVDLQSYGESAWLAWLTRARERWGLVHRPVRARAYTRAVKRLHNHPADEFLRLLSECGLKTDKAENVFAIPADKRAAAKKLFAEFGLSPDRTTVFIQPFTSTPHKNWPLEKWMELAGRLKDLNIQVLFGGGPADRAPLETALLGKFPISAGADLLTSCALTSLCALTVGADTGLIHLANAAGGRVIALEHFGQIHIPYGHPDWVIAPEKPGMWVATIEVEVVLAEIRRVIRA